MMMDFQIIASVIIIDFMKVQREKSKRRSDIINEIVLMFVLYTSFCFSDWVPDLNVQFMIGYVPILAVCVLIYVTIYSILRETFSKIKLLYLKKRAMRNYKR